MVKSSFRKLFPIASKKEFHPSPYANGPATLKFFADQFGFTNPRDVVALMGAHTLGGLDQRNSFFKYFWNRGEHSYFNNQYYKTIVSKNAYAIQCINEAKDGFAFIGKSKLDFGLRFTLLIKRKVHP